MCNCGNKRNSLRQEPINQNIYTQQMQQPIHEQQVKATAQAKQIVMFQYTGKTRLTVTGTITRKNYRFNFPGDIQHIELSDAAAMTAVPVLKRV
jgi:hypothetical protein